ncbi:MAG: hypothetical protein Q9202_005414 [Teloschistes flavicans]
MSDQGPPQSSTWIRIAARMWHRRKEKPVFPQDLYCVKALVHKGESHEFIAWFMPRMRIRYILEDMYYVKNLANYKMKTLTLFEWTTHDVEDALEQYKVYKIEKEASRLEEYHRDMISWIEEMRENGSERMMQEMFAKSEEIFKKDPLELNSVEKLRQQWSDFVDKTSKQMGEQSEAEESQLSVCTGSENDETGGELIQEPKGLV